MPDSGALRQRLTIGPVLIALLVALFWCDARLGPTAPLLLVLAVALALRSAWEYVDLLRAGGIDAGYSLVAACVVSTVAANWAWLPDGETQLGSPMIGRLGPVMLAYALAVMVLLGNAVASFRGPGGNLQRLGAQVLGVSYVAVFLSAAVQLRWVAGSDLCYLPLASIVAVTKCGDTAAFFAGRAFGGRKLSPLVSPGKTWAGFWGALGGAAFGGWFCLSIVPRWFGAAPAAWPWSIGYGLAIGALGVVGDLAESLIKRDVGRKDSAPLLPGFGGLLDLLDSVIFTGPAAYLLWLLLPLPR